MNIGSIRFDIDANTQGLRKATAEIVKFRGLVTRTANSQAQGAKQVAGALSRQESAMKKAFQQAKAFQLSLEHSGMKADEVAKRMRPLEAALQRYVKEMSSGKLSTIEFTRAQDGFIAKMNRMKRELADTQAAGKLGTVLRNLESASVLAVGPLSGLGARIRSLGAIASRTNLALVGLIAGITAAVTAVAKLSVAGVTANREFAKAEARFKSASGSAVLAAESMEYVKDVSNSLGLSVIETARAFSRFQAAAMGTRLEGEGARKVFEGIANAAAALRLSAVEVEGVMRAVEQMLSKGTVQAEELRGQLGERLPGAFRLAADAMKTTTQGLNKMLKDGKVVAEEFLPLLAEKLMEMFQDDAKDNVDSFTGSLNVMKNKFLEFAAAVDESLGLSDKLISIFKGLGRLFEVLGNNLRKIGHLTIAVLAGVATFYAGTLIPLILKAATATLTWAKAQLTLNAAISASGLGKVAIVIGKLVAAAVVALATYAGLSYLFGDVAEEINALDAETEELLKSLEELTAESLNTTEAFTAFEKEIQNAANAMQAWKNAARFKTTQEEELLRLETRAKFAAMSTDDLKASAKALGEVLGWEVFPDVEMVTAAFLELVKASEDEAAAMGAAEKATEGLKNAQQQLLDMRKQLAAMKQGQEQYDLYKNVTTKVDEFKQSLRDAHIAEALINRYAAEYLGLLTAITAEQQRLNQEKALAKSIAKEELAMEKQMESARKKAADALDKANEAIDVMRQRVTAVGKGAEALRVFNDVERPVAQFKFQLEQAGVAQADLNARVKEYQALLIQQSNLTGPLAQGAEEIGSAFTGAFEDAIMGAESFKDAMTNMIEEIYNVLLRTLILDPIEDSIQTSLKNFMTQGGTQGSAGNIFTNLFGGGGGGGAQAAGAAGAATAGATATGAAGATGEAAVQAQWQTILTQFQAILTQFQTTVTTCQTACTTLQTGATTLQTAATTLSTTSAALSTTAPILQMGAAQMQGAATMHITAATMLIEAAASLAVSSSVGSMGSGMASGGHVKPGKMYEVTEYGPELLQQGGRQYLIPDSSGRVMTMDQASASGRSGPNSVTNLTVNLPPERRRQTAMQMSARILRQQRRAHARNS